MSKKYGVFELPVIPKMNPSGKWDTGEDDHGAFFLLPNGYVLSIQQRTRGYWDAEDNTADVPGSKFSSTLSDEQISFIVRTGELAAVSGLIEKLRAGAVAEPGLRAEIEKDFTTPIGAVGTNVLIERNKHEGGTVVHRNPGNPRDVPVYLKMTDDADLPLTSKVNFIGGIYPKEEGKPLTAGFYTFFPGDSAPPMSNVEYWNAHGFLATKKEMGALVGKLSKDPAFAEEARAVKEALRSNAPPASSPTRPLQADKPVAGNVALAVPQEVQDKLKAIVDPLYPTFKGEHVTLKLGAKQPSDETAQEINKFQNAKVEVYGVADDGCAVQCLLLRVNGAEADSNGRPYHLTWSLDPSAQVPATYNKTGKPSTAKPMHAAYIATQNDLVTRWPESEVIPLQLSAKFYPEISGAPNPVAVAQHNH